MTKHQWLVEMRIELPSESSRKLHSVFLKCLGMSACLYIKVTFKQRRDAEIALRMQYRAHGMQPPGMKSWGQVRGELCFFGWV